MHCESSSPMPDLKGGGYLATGKGGSKEKGGVRTGGEGAEGGEEGTVDGDSERARMGKERQMPYGVS